MRDRLLAIVLLIGSGYAVAEEPRQWTSRAGGFSVQAALVDVADGNVVLRKTDGTTVRVPLDKLSLGDVRYVAQVMREAERAVQRMPSQPAKVDTQANAAVPSAPPPVEPDDEEPPAAASGSVPPLAAPNRSQWQAVPDSGAIRMVKAAKNLAIPVAVKYSMLQTVIPETASPFVGVFQQASPATLFCYDIRSGRRTGQIEVADGYVQRLCLSPDGRWVAWFKPGQKAVQVAATAGAKSVTEIELSTQFANINYLAFAAPSRLLIGESNEHRMSVWDTKKLKKLCEFALPAGADGSTIALSHGGNYVAVAARGGSSIQIHDVRNGALAGTLAMPTSDAAPGMRASPSAVAFSLDGTEIAALFSEGSTSGLALWSIADGSLINSHRFSKTLNLIAGGVGYEGPSLQFLPDEKGWLLFGRMAVDRQLGEVVWVEPTEIGSPTSRTRRRVLVDGKVLALRGPQTATALTAEELPWNAIEQGIQVVARGGTSEDAKLHPMTQAQDDGAEPVVFAERSQWTAVEPPAEPLKLRAQPIPLDTAPLLLQQLRFAGSASSPVALLVAPSKTKATRLEDGFLATELHRFDLERGRSLGTLETGQPGEFIDFTASGKWALTRTGNQRDRLDLYEIDSGKHVGGFRPNASQKQPHMVSWTGFADDYSLVTLSATGRMVSWQLPELRAQKVIQLDIIRRETFVPVTCWISPSRTNLIVAAAGKLHVIDSKSLKVLGTLQPTATMRGPWQVLALAFDPSGKRLAAEIKTGDDATLAIWDFQNGQLVQELELEQPAFGLSWVDNRFLILHGIRVPKLGLSPPVSMAELSVLDLIDTHRGGTVWRYLVPFGNLITRGPDQRIWYASSTSMISPATLMNVALPTAAATAAVQKLPPRVPILARGSELTLDVKFAALGSPAGMDLITDSIQADLSRQLEARGVKVKPRTGLVLEVSIREQATDNLLRFVVLATGQETSIRETSVECALTLKDITGQVLWQRSQPFYTEPQRLVATVPVGMTAADHFRRLQWQEVLQWFNDGGLPETIYEPLPASGLGESVLGPSGETNIRTF